MKKNIKTLGFVESQSVCPKMNNRSHPCTHQRIFKNLDANLIIIYFGLMGCIQGVIDPRILQPLMRLQTELAYPYVTIAILLSGT